MSAAFPTPTPEDQKLRVLKPYSDEIATDLIKTANRTVENLKTLRSEEFAHWREIAEWISPRRGQWLVTDRKSRSKMHGRIINNVANDSAKIGAAGMQSGLTSRSRPWFQLTTADIRLRRDPEVKIWLRTVEDLLREVLDRSNFYETTRINYDEMFNFGQGAFSIVPDFDNVIRCRHHTIGSYLLGIDHKGKTDTFAEEFVLTVGQLVERYPFERLSLPAQRAAKESKFETTVLMRRLVQPNRGKYYKPGRPGWQGSPFMIMEWDAADQKRDILALMPEYEFPTITPRWESIADYAYSATSPGMEALGDVKQLQAEEINLSRANEQIGNPTVLMPPELRGKVNATLMPGDQLFTAELQGQKGVRRAFEVNPQINELRENIRAIERRIERKYHVDVFMAITRIEGGNMRVVEIDARVREQMSQLGPIVEALSEQQNDPALTRVYRICERAGLIPEPPEALRNSPVKIDYVSILAQAQKSADISKLDRWFIAGQQMALVDPAAKHRFNGDEWMKEYAEQLGVPAKTVRDDKGVAALVAQDQKMAQAANTAALAQAGAKAAKDASQADMTGDNALTAIRDRLQGA